MAIIVLYSVYAGIFIYNTSFVLQDQRYFTLFDDAMISMRYAKNLAAGHGLVWNPGGEEVEGFTNPLWVLFMAVFHLPGIPPPKISLLIQISGAIFLIINLIFVKKIADRIFDKSPAISLASMVLTAFYLPLNNWALQGTEVSILALVVSMTAWKAIQSIDRKVVPVDLYVLLGISTLVRPDMIVPAIVIIVLLGAFDSENRRKHVFIGFGIVLGFILFQTLIRILYYGEWLPNTYYLKLTDYPLFLRIARGLIVTWELILRMDVIFFLLPFLILLFRRDKKIWLLISVFASLILYSIYVGGDAWEYWGGSNRYVSIGMSLFFILLCGSVRDLCGWIPHRLFNHRKLQVAIRTVLFTCILSYAFIRFNMIYNPEPTTDVWLLTEPPLAVADNREMVKLSLLLDEITDREATIATVWAGAIPYFTGRPIVDILGKNDKRIARQTVKVPDGPEKYTDFYPGHMKFDYAYSIGELQPDVIAQFYGITDIEIDPIIAENYWKVLIEGFVLHGHMKSEHIDWHIVNQRGYKWRHKSSLKD